MDDFDLLLTPTVPIEAFPAGLDGPSDVCGVSRPRLSWCGFTYPFNLTGQPAASVPAGLTTAGLPVGLQIVGRWRGDQSVLQASWAYEKARTWTVLDRPGAPHEDPA